MARRAGSLEHVELPLPRAPPPEGQVSRRRRCQQPHRGSRPQHAFPTPPSSPRTGPQAAAAAAARLSPLSLRCHRRLPAEVQLPPWRRRRLFMEPPEPASSGEPRVRRGLWRAPSGRQWPVLAACLTCCTLLGWYMASSVKDLVAVPEGPWLQGKGPSQVEKGPSQEEKGPSQEKRVLWQEEKEPLWEERGLSWEEKDPELQPVTVLVWWRPFGHGILSSNCKKFNTRACQVSTNRSLQLEAHAVVFHHRDLQWHGLGQLPRQRPPEQRWVWMNYESPTHTTGLSNLGGLFNWTMSYRVDSDVFVPSGRLKLRPEPLVQIPLPQKTKLVAWVVSNWNEGHARVRYYHQLKQYLPIDVYGSQRLSLKDNNVVKTVSEYKFYLAFENSQHQDYITEKLWRNAFGSWAVPIVLGPPRANYEQYIPSDAFIHVDDFSNPKELAVYLKFLDKNMNMYRKHFAWRKQYEVKLPSFWEEHCCKVCKIVRQLGKQPKTIQDLAKWFES